ncbi:RNA-guided endonuclease TnpB family protein [Nonomuraea sp. B10E15]|uniref:RNA-guided endonuclease InsQ/TnpB family protein n=1 Tax=Nonomuraea sp. B10E15 TaxID=3153560 RepID=UPI00325DE9AA
MQLRYSFRIDPTPGQRVALAKAFGCARVVFNDALALRRQAYREGLPFVADAELSRKMITEAKKRPERVWLGEVSAVVLQQALADCTTAFRNFFASVTGKRKGPKIAPPRFRSRKDNRQAIRFTKNARFSITGQGMLRLPKIGQVAVRWSRELPAEPSSVTIVKDAAGRYFASFVVEVREQSLPATDAETGIDLGLGHFAILADGRKIDAPKFLRRAERKHAKVSDARREFHHQLSTKIIRENQAVYVENLAVNGLARTRLATSIHDAGWSAFIAMLEYKAKLYGRTFARVSRWFPSSKRCSACGQVRAQSLPLSAREWTCPCGAHHDRDVNAANNILAAGRAERLNACGGPVRPGASPAQPDEAGSPGSAAA